MRRFFILFVIWMLAALPLRAEVPQAVHDLAEALALPEVIVLMRDEGIDFGAELEQDMFPGRGGMLWQQSLDQIYDAQWMNDVAILAFAAALGQAETGALLAFFQSPLGRQITSLEISARRAMMDDAVDEANKEFVAGLIAANDPRIDLITEFIEVNDLLESNVAGAMNSNLAFLNGLAEGGAFPDTRTEEQMLKDIWDQEQSIRDDTREWLYAFLSMAYAPLSDADLLDYIEVSRTREGQLLNTALFAAFDPMFEEISRALGLAAAKVLTSEDL
ncbi:MAG: DUF2059 domain-containing protein [Paracoccaceae bacterium]